MKNLKNSSSSYGIVSITLHWLMAVLFVGMYILGSYMVDLDYYDSWYHRAPELHKSIGITLILFMALRFFWNQFQPKPAPHELNPIFTRLAKLSHYFFYLLSLFLLISGYLISTAKGKGIEIFSLLEIPALMSESSERGDFAGSTHEIIAHLFMLLVISHTSAALFHHFYFKDSTLRRMLSYK